MKDREFLWWLHERLVSVHGEADNADYMWKLRNIIACYESDKVTANIVNSKLKAENMLNHVFGGELDTESFE